MTETEHQIRVDEIQKFKAKLAYHKSKKDRLQHDLDSELEYIMQYQERIEEAESELKND